MNRADITAKMLKEDLKIRTYQNPLKSAGLRTLQCLYARNRGVTKLSCGHSESYLKLCGRIWKIISYNETVKGGSP